MKTFRFAFPQPNGDHPTACVIQARSLAAAVMAAFSKVDRAIIGSTVFEGENWRKLGYLHIGPRLHVGWRPVMLDRRRLMDVQPAHWAQPDAFYSRAQFRAVNGRGNAKGALS